jgi:hypothetical protein
MDARVFGPTTGLSPLDGAISSNKTSENSFEKFKCLHSEVKKYTCTRILYSFQGTRAVHEKGKRKSSKPPLPLNPLTDLINLAMCKFTAVGKEEGKKHAVRQRVTRAWMLEVFTEEFITRLHLEVAFTDQAWRLIKKDTDETYTEGSRQIHAIWWNPIQKRYQGRMRKLCSESEVMIDLDEDWVTKNVGVRYRQDLKGCYKEDHVCNGPCWRCEGCHDAAREVIDNRSTHCGFPAGKC